jgi:SRSO17 transposase
MSACSGPLEGYAARFDDLFTHVAQRRGFREYLAGLLAPRERNKTLTALAGAEPVTGSKLPAVQRLQFFLSESVWDPGAVNSRRLELLLADAATAPHSGGVPAIDDSGDRKDGTETAHVDRQWLGRYGKTDNGVVTAATVWADERLYIPRARYALNPGQALPEGEERPGVPHQAADRRGPRGQGRVCGVRVPGGGRRQSLRRPGRVPPRAGRGGAAVRDGPQAAPRDLGLRR